MSRVYFTDRYLGKQFPRLLAEAGIAVCRHGDVFAPDGSDEEWLQHCERKGWVAITHDQRIRYMPNERAAMVRHRVRVLVLVGQVPKSAHEPGFGFRPMVAVVAVLAVATTEQKRRA